MNKQVSSPEAILAQCRRLVMEKGLAAVNMRSVAAACGVALGSLYNYFPSKSALIAATVESVWTDIFYGSRQPQGFGGFLQAVAWVHESLLQGSRSYRGFFTLHTFSFASQDKPSARERMEHHTGLIRQRLMDALKEDKRLDASAFEAGFQAEDVVNLAFNEVIAAVIQQKGQISTLLGLLKRALYRD